ncbi:hypothetical protein M0813_12625 [Anaeramoeba flamelloides]|uniref:BTB domain-containing protein n=1 Tax=Anaeramoeba flamelloides TaxID=1746091 RepID=A0ABQ8ZBB3_9EUKA|nr:hypothetical protein M0813_12625 [Anaeramoeba flamelloides]
MDFKLIKEDIQPYYQQCPGCSKLNFLYDRGLGFQKCRLCGKIYCNYCALEHPDEYHGFSHYLGCHNSQEDQEIRISNLEEIIKVVETVTLQITLNNISTKMMVLRHETIGNVLEIYKKKRNQPSLSNTNFKYRFDNCKFVLWFSEENKTIRNYGLKNGNTITLKKPAVKKWKKEKFSTNLQRLDNNSVLENIILGQRLKTEKEVRNKIAENLNLESEKILLYFDGKGFEKNVYTDLREVNKIEQCKLWVITVDERDQASKLTQVTESYKNLLNAKEQTDLEISGIKVHSSMLKLRTDLQPQYIKSQLENASLNQEDYQEFVEYIYGQDHKINNESVKKCFGVLGLHSGTLQAFGQQLINKFYQKNNNEKDFAILVPDPEEPEEVEAVNIHKIILQARSGLFRNMFNNINDNISQVKEYSGKSIGTIEVIVKYLYTNTLEITADMDPQIILEELQDAQEYFQINPKYNFVNELHQLSLRSKQN